MHQYCSFDTKRGGREQLEGEGEATKIIGVTVIGAPWGKELRWS